MTTSTTAVAPTTAAPLRHLLTHDGLGPGGLGSLLDLTRRLKRDPEAFRNRLAGGRIGMIFDKPSTRTRVSFESAAWMLGMLPIVLRPDELQLGRGETISDTARALSLSLAWSRPDRPASK
jgi:ornithine carbamoyltransferase